MSAGGFLTEGKMAKESKRVKSKSHLLGLAQEIIKGKGIICCLPFHASSKHIKCAFFRLPFWDGSPHISISPKSHFSFMLK